MMHAMVVEQYGPPEVIRPREMPEPVMGEHDLLLEVHAVAANPLDARIRRQGLGGPRPLPFIQGYDVSGVVRDMGPKASGFAVGDEVYASPNPVRNGANAERVCVDARTAAPKPRTLDHIRAAALPLVTLAAWDSLYERANLQPGETVLIQAGGGGVGHVATQLAKARGCRVLATASTAESIRVCQRVGADVIIDYRRQNVVERVRAETSGKGCAVALDTLGGRTGDQCLDCLAVHGRMVSLVATSIERLAERLRARNATLHMELVDAPTRFDLNHDSHGRILREITRMVDAGQLHPHVSNVMHLGELVRAHCLQEQGHVPGKIVLAVC